MSADLSIYDAMEPPLSEYEQGVRDGIESAVRQFSMLRYNAASQWISPPIEGVKDQNCFLRIDHVDEVLGRMATSVRTEGRDDDLRWMLRHSAVFR